MQTIRLIRSVICPEEIELLAEHQRALDQHLANARLRLDAIRLIQREPVQQPASQ